MDKKDWKLQFAMLLVDAYRTEGTEHILKWSAPSRRSRSLEYYQGLISMRIITQAVANPYSIYLNQTLQPLDVDPTQGL